MGQFHLSNSVSDEIACIYLATELEAGQANPVGTEDLAHKCVPFSEAMEMVIRGEIADSITVIAVLHYALLMTGQCS